jgi:hypothetical protein
MGQRLSIVCPILVLFVLIVFLLRLSEMSNRLRLFEIYIKDQDAMNEKEDSITTYSKLPPLVDLPPDIPPPPSYQSGPPK